MNNKSKNKGFPTFSPENYIRKKVRSLQIAGCKINTGWKEWGMANIVVMRKHTNGNITAGFFLTDVFCLGVKDTMYLVNVPEYKFFEHLHSMEEQHDFEEIDYSLAHNIIWSAVDYAEEFGFKPHKDFTNTTQFFLEEDTDDIALIEIECGKDGKPFYIQGDDNNLKANQVIAQLELTTGKGNYRFAIEYTPSDGNPTNENFLD